VIPRNKGSTPPIQEIRKIHFKALKLVEELFLGAYKSRFKGKGIEFEEARPFVNGDEIRSIDWKLTAKTGTPYVKLFREERELQVILLVDISKSLLFGSHARSKKEIAAEISTLIALAAIRSSDRIGLILFAKDIELFIRPNKGIFHVDRLLRELLSERPLHGEGTDLGKALLFLNKVTPKRAVVFLISDFLSPHYEKPLKIASLRHDLISIRLFDPEEVKPPEGLYRAEDLETHKMRILDMKSPKNQSLVSDIAKAKRDEIRKNVEKSGSTYIEIDITKPFFEPLQKALHK
jgi:uncharacterized protein (DUF58 family)